MEFEEFSTEKLIEAALAEKDDEKRWSYVTVLHKRGTEEVFEVAKSLCESGEAEKIKLGADILGQLGFEALPFKEQTLPILMASTESKFRLSENEAEIGALQSVIFALGRMEEKSARRRLLEFAGHKNEDIRYAVVHGLLTVDADDEIAALIELSRDSDEDVRNWATFGLGSQIDRDAPEIRAALAERLNEGEGEVEQEILGEALVGLARRKDERIIDLLLKRLTSDSIYTLDVEAAAEIGDAQLCEALLRLKEWWDVNTFILDEAIENCCASGKENAS